MAAGTDAGYLVSKWARELSFTCGQYMHSIKKLDTYEGERASQLTPDTLLIRGAHRVREIPSTMAD